MSDVVRIVGGRLASSVDPVLEKRLYPGPIENLRQSYFAFHAFDKAHTVSLAEAGLIPLDAAQAILNGLRQMEREGITQVRDRMGGGRHSGEAYLTETIGPEKAGWINLGRSSGDLDATAWRLVFRSKAPNIINTLCALRSALTEVAEKNLDTVMPGHTCLQHAQTTTLAHTFMAWEAALSRDVKRFLEVYDATSESPAGAAIMTGSTFPLRRERTAELLGFDNVAGNTRDAVLNLDIILQAHTTTAICTSNLMRVAQDLFLWATSEFGYVDLPDSYCSTSSIMPQKKNPWGLAWIRGEGSLALGHLSGVFTMLKAESDQLEATMLSAWELWKVIDLLDDMAKLLAGVIKGAKFNTERLYELASAHFCQATDLAALLVTEAGLPWREAHQFTARIVRAAVDAGMKPCDITIEFLNTIRKQYNEEPLSIDSQRLVAALDPRQSILARDAVQGSPSPRQVLLQIQTASENIQKDVKNADKILDNAKRASDILEQAIDHILGV